MVEADNGSLNREEEFETLDRCDSALVYAFRIDCCAVLPD